MKINKYFIVIAVAILIKFLLFAFTVMYVPQASYAPDSDSYFKTAEMLHSKGAFATQNSSGSLISETWRTPGYPLFLAITRNVMKIPLVGIIFIQILFTILAALIVYKIALQIDSRIAILGVIIVLYDIPVSVFSLMFLSEALYLFFISLFIFCFIKYLKQGKIEWIVVSALVLVAATYVRAVSYYLGLATAIFVIYANISRNFKKTFIHAFIFLIIVYSFLGIWQIRNYRCCKEKSFSTVSWANFNTNGLLTVCPSESNDSFFSRCIKSIPCYTKATWSALLSLMTRPGSLKYFKSQPLAIIGKALAYPWMIFWMIGFLVGILKIRYNIYYQFATVVILYFIVVTIVNAAVIAGERFRIPMVPCIAIISAYGWLNISFFKPGRFFTCRANI